MPSFCTWWCRSSIFGRDSGEFVQMKNIITFEPHEIRTSRSPSGIGVEHWGFTGSSFNCYSIKGWLLIKVGSMVQSTWTQIKADDLFFLLSGRHQLSKLQQVIFHIGSSWWIYFPFTVSQQQNIRCCAVTAPVKLTVEKKHRGQFCKLNFGLCCRT